MSALEALEIFGAGCGHHLCRLWGTTLRKHSKFSASGAERWFNCPGSVDLSEGLPDTTNKYAEEGTNAHEALETILNVKIQNPMAMTGRLFFQRPHIDKEMIAYGLAAAEFILNIWDEHPESEIMVETRISLDFIHPEAFGTFDSGIVEHFGTLHVFDYKYGKSMVSPTRNLQMIFYALALADKYRWNFKRVRMWIVQPRSRGYDGPTFWETSISELIKEYIPKFESAVARVEGLPEQYVEGSWCHFCKAKNICPLKTEGKARKAKSIFSDNFY